MSFLVSFANYILGMGLLLEESMPLREKQMWSMALVRWRWSWKDLGRFYAALAALGLVPVCACGFLGPA